MKRKILAVVIGTLFLCPWTAYGQPGFLDVATDHAFYQEIEYFRREGIIRGDGNGYYRPYIDITAAEYLLMLHHTTGYACSLYGCPEYLVKGMLSDFGIRHLTEDKYISKLDVLVQGCAALGIEPYSARYYTTEYPVLFDGMTQNERDILSFCERYDVLSFADETMDSLYGPITRGEAAGFLYQLIQLQDTTFVQPDISAWINIELSEEVTEEVELWNALAELPDWLIADFHDSGMKLKVYPFSAEDNERGVAGRYYFGERITLNSDSNGYSTIYHEFGHHLYFRFLADRSDRETVDELYEAEKRNLGIYFREYGTTDPMEFFADAFTWYMESQLNHTQQKMAQAVPMTYAYMDQLINELGGLDRM